MTDSVLTSNEQVAAGLALVEEGLEGIGVTTEPLLVLLAVRDSVAKVEREARELREEIEQKIAAQMTADSMLIDGVGVVKRSHRKSKHALPDATESLIRDVMDSRMVNPETGEILDESPAEKLTAVFGMSIHNARNTQLKARGLNERDYAEIRYADEWTVSIG